MDWTRFYPMQWVNTIWAENPNHLQPCNPNQFFVQNKDFKKIIKMFSISSWKEDFHNITYKPVIIKQFESDYYSYFEEEYEELEHHTIQWSNDSLKIKCCFYKEDLLEEKYVEYEHVNSPQEKNLFLDYSVVWCLWDDNRSNIRCVLGLNIDTHYFGNRYIPFIYHSDWNYDCVDSDFLLTKEFPKTVIYDVKELFDSWFPFFIKIINKHWF